jgi:hypothetical protein
MAISKEVILENDVTINYIRIEFLYTYNEKNNKSVFCRIGLYVTQTSIKPVEIKETSYSWEELGYTGSEELFPLVYAKLKEVYVDAIDII